VVLASPQEYARLGATEGGAIAASLTAPEPRVDVPHPPRPILIGALFLAAVAAAVAAYGLSLSGDQGPERQVHAGIVAWITLSYTICGLIAWWRRPESRFGPLMVAAGFSPMLARLTETDSDLLQATGQALSLLPPVLFLHVFLSYPTGRLTGAERVLVAAGYATIALFDLPRAIFGATGRDEAQTVVQNVQRAAILAIALAALVVLVRRRWSSGRPLRRSSGWLGVCFALALVALAVGIGMRAAAAPGTDVVRAIAFGLVGVAPLLLLSGFLRDRLARSSVGELVVELGSDPRPAELQTALGRALRDPSVTLVYWVPEFESYADLEGREVEPPDESDGRAVTVIERDGVRVAALIHDPSLGEERELLDAVTAAAGIALENAQLHVELRARLEELRGSRARIIDAGQKERQRLERNLHDGAQQRLIALALDLSRLEERLRDDQTARVRLAEARTEIALSLQELRDVARGLHPAVVSGHGLEVALESMVARAAFPVLLTVEVAGRLPERVEVAAYYVVSESLANIAKHAQATTAKVDVVHGEEQLVVEVVDDGIGGADSERGSGLRGLADRVESLNGRLRVWTPLGGGTRVRAEIPCA
jgi:signal transduction histidine kinase